MIVRNRVCREASPAYTPLSVKRWLSAAVLERRLANPVQSYVSTSRDPFLNLSIEHHLLQRSATDSAILFLYVNRPSIIIGRNQNPWLEVNLALLGHSRERPETEPPSLGVVDLVRRRSGGGTVFHDEGNINWTIICPTANFTRDKHAEMVVRALRGCGVERARVNQRHDIVLDRGEHVGPTDPQDTHRTPYTSEDQTNSKSVKVSGSAYKLIKGRALHHGTCLLSSPNLNIIPHYLHSPAKPYITARGVESVSSPVGNILLSNTDFSNAVQERFNLLYRESGSSDIVDEVGEEMLQLDSIRKGYDELKSRDWTYLQTPQFVVSNAADITAELDLELHVRYGTITKGSIHGRKSNDLMTGSIGDNWNGSKLHEIESWKDFVSPHKLGLNTSNSAKLIDWLHKMLPQSAREDGR